MYNEYHDYSLVATAECFVWFRKLQSYNHTRCNVYIRGASPCGFVVFQWCLWYFIKRSEMVTSIDFSNISTYFWGKHTNNSDQGAIIRWLIVPRSSWSTVPHVAKLKIIVEQEKIILEFAVILV